MLRRLGPRYLPMLLAIFLVTVAAYSPAATAQAQVPDPIEGKTYRFNIEADDLSAELAQFSEFTGQQIFYESALTRGHNGRAVHDELTMLEGLLVLLQGTGLSPHLNGGGISLSQSQNLAVSSASPAGAPASEKRVSLGTLTVEAKSLEIGGQDYLAYASYVASQVKAALWMNSDLIGTKFDVPATISVNASGHIVGLQLATSSGNDHVDKEIALTLDHLAVNPPPPDTALTIRIRIQSAEP